MVTPFLKWAGGKRWFVQNHSELLPASYKRYIEPFLGSAAVFFHLNPKIAMLTDSNPRLIETYQALKTDYTLVEKHLKKHQKLHCTEHYYDVRARKYKSIYTRAAQFIYLNRTCWNGLYRENKKGIFNVPIGTKTNVILTTDNFAETSKRLQRAELVHSDFEKAINIAQDGDFLFVDPPYTVAHNNNGFVKYNQNIFSWSDQQRLKLALDRARNRGAFICVTNANHESIHELYDDFGVSRSLNRKSVISGLNKGRSKTSEVCILSY